MDEAVSEDGGVVGRRQEADDWRPNPPLSASLNQKHNLGIRNRPSAEVGIAVDPVFDV